MSCSHKKQGSTQRPVGMWQKYIRTRLKRRSLAEFKTKLSLKRVSSVSDYIHKSIVKERRESTCLICHIEGDFFSNPHSEIL